MTPMQSMIRAVAVAAAVAAHVGGFAALAAGRAAAAETYPSRAVTMVVPFTAGGPTDVVGRILAQHMGQTLGRQIIIENITGAGGTLAAVRVAKSAPDGYTMILGNLGTHAAALGVYRSLAYDPRTDFEPVIWISANPMVLVVRRDLPVMSVRDLIALARTRKVNFGSAGLGSIAHLALLLFNSLTGADLQHVPYRGLPQVVNDMLAGQIDGLFDQAVSATPQIAAGAEKPIVVTARTRAPQLPEVPSAAEAGVPGLETTAWTGLFVPRGTARMVVDRLNAAVDEALRNDAVARQLSALGADLTRPDRRAPEVLAALVRSEVDKWVPLIRAAGVAE